jgi:hypothetical protein
VNVGMGATDPAQKMARFTQWLMVFANICKAPPPGIDLKEVWKEGSGLAGYQDGTRFLIDGANPEVIKLQQQVQKLTQLLQKSPLAKSQQVTETNKTRERIADKNNVVKLALHDKQHASSSKQMLVQHLMDMEKGGVQRQGEVEDRDFGALQEKEAANAGSGKS